MKISVVVLTYRRPDMLQRQLEGLRALTGLHEVLVVDNDPESQQELSTLDDLRVRQIRVDHNGGAVARSIGMEQASGDLVITLDDDVLGLDEADLVRLTAAFEDEPRLGALCFKVVHGQTGAITNWCHHCDPREFAGRRFETYEISEGAVAFRATALGEVGAYPLSFFISHEGLDMACRLMQADYRVEYTPDVTVEHHHAPQGRPSWRRYYYDTRNQLWVAARNFPAFKAAAYLAKGLASMAAYSIRDGFFRYWLKAIRDGLAGLPREWRARNRIDSRVLARMREIDRHREGTVQLIRKRLFRRGVEI